MKDLDVGCVDFRAVLQAYFQTLFGAARLEGQSARGNFSSEVQVGLPGPKNEQSNGPKH